MKPRCPTCHRLHKRSHPQNARYWLLLHAIADKVRPLGVEHSAEIWHEYFKSRYIGCDDVTLPNGRVLTRTKSTTDLDVAEFNDYMARVEEWARDRDVWLDEIASAA